MRNSYSGATLVQSFAAIDSFVATKKCICIYGAGVYGKTLWKYMQRRRHKVAAFLISDGEKKAAESIDDIPVKFVSEMSNNEAGVILALQERHHCHILSHSLAKIAPENILTLNDVFFGFALQLFLRLPTGYEPDFELRAREILRKYKIVEFCVTMIECFGLMMYFSIQKKLEKCSDEVLQVFIPDFFMRGDDIVDFFDEKPGNIYFYNRLKEEHCFLTHENVKFWRYFLENYTDRIVFNQCYTWDGMYRFQHDYQNGSLNTNRSYFAIKDDELKDGENKAERLGIKMPYICFNARSNRYFVAVNRNDERTQSQSDQRNCSAEKFKIVSCVLGKIGVQTVRMGYLCDSNMQSEDIVDYTQMPHDDFMDYYLIAKSAMVICQFSGFHYMAILFNKPTLITDAVSLTIQGDIVDMVNPAQDIMLIKKIRSPHTGRYMSLKEILAVEEEFPDLYKRADYYAANGYEFVENTGEEIAYATMEILDRMQEKKKYDREYYELQDQVRSLRKKSALRSGNLYWDIPFGEYFLKNNLWMLD